MVNFMIMYMLSHKHNCESTSHSWPESKSQVITRADQAARNQEPHALLGGGVVHSHWPQSGNNPSRHQLMNGEQNEVYSTTDY